VTPRGPKSGSDDFTAVKRLVDDDPTTQVDLDDLPTGELARGTRIGDYVIEDKIGQGGMGSVYRAVHPVIGKHAAVKVLEVDAGQYGLERFLDEARVVNQIGHPNIVDVFAFGETPDGRSYLVMEWLKGATLRERMDRAALSLAELRDVVRPLIRALAAAHGKGVVHRDLKPDNVFLVDRHDEPPLVKLLDFGIAKPASTEHRVARTATGAIVGTPLYIAPEQAKGREIDAAADVYALGGMLFEMLCGRPPFVADNAMEIVAKHLMEPPPRPSQLAPVPSALDDLIVAMLAKDPKARPALASVLEVIEQVNEQVIEQVNEQVIEQPVGVPSTEPDVFAARATPWPMRPSTAPMPAPTPSGALDEPRVDAPRARPWKWMVPLGVVVAGALAFAITRLVGGSANAPEPVAPEPSVPAARAPVEPAPPSPGHAVATPANDEPAPTTVAPPPPKPAARPVDRPAVRPTVRRPSRKNPPPKPKPRPAGSGTMDSTRDLLEPGTLR